RVRDFHPLERAHGAQTKNSMKPSGLGIIELFRKQSYFHAMNKSITQTAQYDKQISKSIKRFLQDFMFTLL
ncbi:hypothetical protein LJB63_15740, partial [[Eubacterium] rectale]|nr:hypothetical protein [Agathobacter rectalis]